MLLDFFFFLPDGGTDFGLFDKEEEFVSVKFFVHFDSDGGEDVGRLLNEADLDKIVVDVGGGNDDFGFKFKNAADVVTFLVGCPKKDKSETCRLPRLLFRLHTEDDDDKVGFCFVLCLLRGTFGLALGMLAKVARVASSAVWLRSMFGFPLSPIVL